MGHRISMEGYCRQQLDTLEKAGRLRKVMPIETISGTHCMKEDQTLMFNLSSNDYLGLGGEIEFLFNFHTNAVGFNVLDRYGMGSKASRLLAGDRIEMHNLEALLTKNYGRSALLFNSGYHINIGILPALYGKGDLIVSDKLNHASIVDGTKLSAAETKRYNHLEYEQLRYILSQHRKNANRAVIVSESVFSMDGDVADINELIAIKKEFDCELYLDEAHGIGLYGERGLGKAEEIGIIDDIDYLIGVFGKALVSQGSFVICAEEIRNYLINKSRSFIFTTALPPITVYWNNHVFKKMMTMKNERQHLQKISNYLRDTLHQKGLRTAGETNIIPVIFGDEHKTLYIAENLYKKGYFVLPIRPPSVPEGSCRLRLSLTASMQQKDIENIVNDIIEAEKEWK